MKVNTARNYRSHWAHFRSVVPTDPSRVTEFEANDYLKSLDRKRFAASTINARTSCLRSVFDHLKYYRVCAENPFRFGPAAKFKVSGRQRRPNQKIDRDLVSKLLNLPSRVRRWGIRDRAMLAVLFGGGLRISEMLNIRLEDVTITPKMMRVALPENKSGKPQRAVLPKWVGDAVESWLAVRPECTEPFLFISNRRQRLSTSTFRTAFIGYCAELGFRCTVHSTRVTAITKLLDEKVPHREVQEFSRHASIRMVEHYHHWFCEDENHPGLKLDYDEKKPPT